jgi:hypothetical protein
MGNIFCPYMLGWTDLQTVWALTVNKPEAYTGVAELFLLLSPSQPHTYTCITHKPEILTVCTYITESMGSSWVQSVLYLLYGPNKSVV